MNRRRKYKSRNSTDFDFTCNFGGPRAIPEFSKKIGFPIFPPFFKIVEVLIQSRASGDSDSNPAQPGFVSRVPSAAAAAAAISAAVSFAVAAATSLPASFSPASSLSIASFQLRMGNLVASCFARSATSSQANPSSVSAAPTNFFSAHFDAVNCVAAAGPESFLSCSDDKTVRLSSARDGAGIKQWNVGHAAQRCWWAHDNLSLAADRGGRVTWLVEQNGNCEIGATRAHKLTVNALAGNVQEDMVLTGSRDAVVKVWSLSTQQEIHVGHLDQNVCTWATWIPNSPCCLQASEDLRLRIWDTRIGLSAAASEFVGHNNIITCCDVALKDSETYFASCSNGFDGAGCEVMIWDRRITSAPLHSCSGHTETVSSCCFIDGSGGQYLVSTSADGTMRVWNSLDGKCESVANLPENKRTLCCAAQSSLNSGESPSSLATGCVDGTLYLWQVTSEKADAANSVRVNARNIVSTAQKPPKSSLAQVGVSYSSNAAAASMNDSNKSF